MSQQREKSDYLIARLSELAARAVKSRQAAFSHFLDPAQMQEAALAARKQGASLAVWGGYPDAERCLAAFASQPWEDAPQTVAWPMCWLRCRWHARYGTVEHRDLLGAMMGQGVVREHLGDILLFPGVAYCAMAPEIAEHMAVALDKAGRVTLTCDMVDHLPELPESHLVWQRETVASLRLDGIVAAGWNLSRSDAAELVAQGRVRVNYLLEERPDKQVPGGALLSVRGLGRMRLGEVGPPNKKGRVPIQMGHFR